jgi:exonuclease SbcC
VERATAALAALHIPPDPEAAKATANSTAITERCAREEEITVRRRLTQQREYVARLQGALDTLGGVEDQTTTLAARRERLASERSGWVLVEQAFGRDGLQALEIDAAGPEVSSITNELLLAVFGPRFTLSLRTVTEAKGGRVQREVFDVLVLDGESGGSRTYAALSGGQQVLIDVSLRLALCIFNARRNAHMFDSLFCDEIDGALDETLSARFPAMLRRAMALGGFSRIYFVSHKPAVSAQADALIEVANGRASIVVL